MASMLTLTVRNTGNSTVKDACWSHDITTPTYATPNLNPDYLVHRVLYANVFIK